MKLLFFFTSFNQLNENKFQLYVFNQLNNINIDLSIDIIIHNNNKNYNLDMIQNSLNQNELLKIKIIKNIDYIHTNKNIGYLWGAQEALSDNFHIFTQYDYVIHLNTNVYITNILNLINYLYDNLNNNIIFFVNKFRDGREGFKTNFTIFKPKINVYSEYNNKIYKKNLKPREIPEKMLEYQIKTNNIKFTFLPSEFIPINDLLLTQYNIGKNIYHIHDISNIYNIFMYDSYTIEE
jgi:hypothetical protein